MGETERILRVPNLGEVVDDVRVVAVYVRVGQVIEEAQPLVDLETHKATIEIPSPCSGRVARVMVEVGDVIKAGDPIAAFVVVSDSEVPVVRPDPVHSADVEWTARRGESEDGERVAVKTTPDDERVDSPSSQTLTGSAEAREGPSASGARSVDSVPDRACDPVLLGAAAPASCRIGGEFTARFFAYEREFEQEIAAHLAGVSPSSKLHVGLGRCCWKTGTLVTVVLTCRELEIARPSLQFAWSGTWNKAEFDASVPSSASEGTTVLKYEVYVEGVHVAALRLDLLLTSSRPSASATGLTRSTVQAARSAFASYSSQDELRVLDRVAAIRTNAGIDVFVDCHSLYPGEQWRPRLRHEIVSRDTFLLFWSHSARRSKEVTWEWTIALEEKGEQAIQIHPLGPRGKPPPPRRLRHIHFGDPLMDLRHSKRSWFPFLTRIWRRLRP